MGVSQKIQVVQLNNNILGVQLNKPAIVQGVFADEGEWYLVDSVELRILARMSNAQFKQFFDLDD